MVHRAAIIGLAMVAMVTAMPIIDVLPSSNAAADITFNVDTAAKPSPFPHYWEMCVGSGHAALALRADYRDYMTRVQKDIGFQYVRFHGLFNDDMSSYTLINGVPTYSFFNIDSIFDFLSSIKMRPVIELSFMPEILASGNTTIFHYKGNITPPKNYTHWATFITTFAQHIISRYGLSEVSQWYFEVWNEPNCGFWTGTQAEYFKLYAVTAQALKSVNQLLQVGGPATCQSAWIPEFVHYCTVNKVPYDFISTHEYPTDIMPFTRDMMKGVFTKARSQTPKGVPLFYTEFNDGLYGEPPYHDMSFAASYIAKTVADGEGIIDMASWWTFSDIFEEAGFASTPFGDVNGWGLLSRHGIKKPSYHAYALLHQAGEWRLPMNASITTSSVGAYALTNDHPTQSTISLFVFNYDDPTKPWKNQAVSVKLANLPFNIDVTATVQLVDQTNGNAATAWQAMGKPEYLNAQQLAQLNVAATLQSQPLTTTRVSATTVQLDLPVVAGNSLAVITVLVPRSA